MGRLNRLLSNLILVFIFQALAISGAVRFLTFACNKFISETVKSVSRRNRLLHDVASQSDLKPCNKMDKV